jgi:hypothetical protein
MVSVRHRDRISSRVMFMASVMAIFNMLPRAKFKFRVRVRVKARARVV